MRKVAFPAFTTEIGLFLALIPFISALNYYLTYTNVRLNSFFVTTYLIDTAQGYMAWLVVHNLIGYLDRTLPYERGVTRRILVQLALTTLLGILIISALTELVNAMARSSPVASVFYTRDIWIFLIWFLVANGIYISLYFYRQYRASETLRQQAVQLRARGLTVDSGRQHLVIAFEEIAGLRVEQVYVLLCTRQAKQYVYGKSLDKVADELPEELFFRLNRQFILHRDTLTGYDRLENGKVLVRLKPTPGFPADVAVSRTKAPAFKSWFDGD